MNKEEIIIANQTGSKSENREKRFEYRSGAIENDLPIFAEDGTTIEYGILNSQGIQHKRQKVFKERHS